jgi:hypothetical protein
MEQTMRYTPSAQPRYVSEPCDEEEDEYITLLARVSSWLWHLCTQVRGVRLLTRVSP